MEAPLINGISSPQYSGIFFAGVPPEAHEVESTSFDSAKSPSNSLNLNFGAAITSPPQKVKQSQALCRNLQSQHRSFDCFVPNLAAAGQLHLGQFLLRLQRYPHNAEYSGCNHCLSLLVKLLHVHISQYSDAFQKPQ